MEMLPKDVNSMLSSVSSWWGTDTGKTDKTPTPNTDNVNKGEGPQQGSQEGTGEGAATATVGDTPAPQADSAPAGEAETSGAAADSPNSDNTSQQQEGQAPGAPNIDIDLEEISKKAVSAAKDWGTYFFKAGKTATQQMTEQVSKTAKQLKDTIDDKTMIGDFNKLQTKFIGENQEKKKKSEAAVAPWIGYNEEEAMKSQILALSADKRNFLRNPPAGVQFNFDFEASFPVAMAMLQEDENLKQMRFDLVPKQVQEDIFWRNYFYRVSLIKQSAQLTSLAQQTGSTAEPAARSTSKDGSRDAAGTSSVPGSGSGSSAGKEDKEDFQPGSPAEGDHEFISDTFQDSQITEDDIKKEMQQLGMSDKEDDIPEWERELQAELQEYEVVNDGNDLDDAANDALEQEILDQLEAESGEGGGT